MIPTGATITNETVEIIEQPSQTYQLDFSTNRIVGMVDGLDAVRQAVFKILQTERFQYLIYTPNYGVELNKMIGSEPAFIRSELKRRITEALLQDDRIESVEDFNIEIDGDSATVSFVVVSQFGSFEASKVVNGSV